MIGNKYRIRNLNELEAIGFVNKVSTNKYNLFSIKTPFVLSNGVIVTKQGSIIKESTNSKLLLESCLKEISKDYDKYIKSEVKELKGIYVSLIYPNINDLNILFNDVIPKIIFLENSSFNGKYIVHKNKLLIDILNCLDINNERIAICDNTDNIQVEELILNSSIIPNYKESFVKILNIFKKQALKLELKEKNSSNHRVYLINENDKYIQDKIVNLKELLNKYNFEIIDISDLSFNDIVNKFSKTNFLISECNKSTVCSLFMPKSSVIIDIFDPKQINTNYIIPTIELLSHNYFPLTLPHENAYEYDYGYDFTSPNDLIRITIENQLYRLD